MKRAWLTGVSLLLVSCGGPAAQVAGTYTGQSNVFVSAGEQQSASEFVTVTQNGGEISFSVAQCPMKAYASGSTTFTVEAFKCTRYLVSQAWELSITDGTVTSNASTFSLQAKGRARAGTQDEPMTFSFSGSQNNR